MVSPYIVNAMISSWYAELMQCYEKRGTENDNVAIYGMRLERNRMRIRNDNNGSTL